MKIASIVYSTDQGLGILAKAFYDHGVVTHPLVIVHAHHPSHHEEWYPDAPTMPIKKISVPDLQEFVKGMDVMLFFETPFHWPIIDYCRTVGVKTVLMPMHECTPVNHPKPDLYLNPSELDYKVFGGAFLNIPVEMPWKQRTRAKTFVHNAGHGGLRGRNGTKELVEAMRHVKSNARLTLRAQESSRQYWAGGDMRQANDLPIDLSPNIDLMIGTFAYNTLFAEGDVFVFPEKFNGLSLPLQEAYASGMAIVAGDRFPLTEWLPREPLIPIKGYQKSRIGGGYVEFDEAIIDPVDIARVIDGIYDQDITELSNRGKQWAEAHSWEQLKPEYLELLKP